MAAFNPARAICNHLVGENHSVVHRLGAGALIMGSGVLVAKAGGDGLILHFIADLVGYAIHGIGLIPFVDKLIELYKN